MRYRLPLILAAGFLLRVFIPIGKVFSGGYVNFLGPDSYYHADVMRQGLAVFPHLHGSFYDWLVVGISWVIGLGHPSVNLMEHVSIFVPPLLALGVIYFVYVMGRRLFGVGAGLFAALLAAVLPGEFFARSLLGAIDHHAFEVFITTAAACIVIVALTQKKPFIWWKFPIYAAGVLLCMVIYRYSWLGASQVFNAVKNLSPSTLLPVFPGATALTTTEAVHVWSLPGNYVPMIDCLMAILFAYFIIRHGAGWRRWVIVAWGAVMMAATIWQLRFDYYLIIPVALLFGCWAVMVKRVAIRNILVSCFLAGVLLIVYTGMVRSDLDTPSDNWNEALSWVRENTPEDSMVIAWWDYGYWIRYRAERIDYINGGQNATRINNFANELLSYTDGTWPEGADYIIIDNDTAFNFKRGLAQWAGKDYRDIDSKRTLVYRLYAGEPLPGYKFAFRNSEVVIYEISR